MYSHRKTSASCQNSFRFSAFQRVSFSTPLGLLSAPSLHARTGAVWLVLKERHEQGVLSSLQFLKAILEIAKEVVEAEKEVTPEEERDRAKEALTELFTNAKGTNTHIIVERIVADIDDIVKKVRFPDWQHTSQGERLVQREPRRTLLKYKLHTDQELFDKAYEYIRQYY
jgi:type I restriction enzyme R subunit